ncbi:hypothetical protein V6N13_026141 [Hibiscus sabdariffa]|uniref:GUN4-like domain-containing protein n=1 Tax=Hibiscus sabdariffa TaxID=183260 RepID=A0ABR2P5F7_9ROSI
MTTTNSLLHHRYSLLKRLSTSESHLPPPPSSLFLHPTTTTTTTSSTTASTTATFSLSPPTSTATTSQQQPISFDTLQHHLSTQNFLQADEETRSLLIVLAGEAAQKRGYVFFSEVQFVAEADLRAIDELWRQYSDGRFGYSVQKRLWQKANKDFTKFFIKVGWMKKLDTEIEQYNYRAFPNEFTWELSDETPEGHLPLTNALRGTQLLNSILSHPAFAGEEDEKAAENEVQGSLRENISGPKPLGSLFPKPDYSF